MFDKIAEWLNAQTDDDQNNGTNGDALRAFVENLYKFVANLLSFFGEWPIDFE